MAKIYDEINTDVCAAVEVMMKVLRLINGPLIQNYVDRGGIT